jgi:hypothetical protein
MQILITDVTEMHQGNYCVAGWNSDAKSMVRPLPGGTNWTEAQLVKHGIEPGAVVGIKVAGSALGGAFPHRTEDTPVELASVQAVGKMSQWFGAGAPPLTSTLAAAFQNSIHTTGGHL